MIRKIIHIDEEKCNGCGLCAAACHEGAIDIIDGKAKLMREHYCDGLGDCLPACPTGAITFTEREAPAYDEAAVLENKRRKEAAASQANSNPDVYPGSTRELTQKEKTLLDTLKVKFVPKKTVPGGCPGSRLTAFDRTRTQEESAPTPAVPAKPSSELRQWPCQIKLVPVSAPFFNGAKLLIAADCTAYAYAQIHQDFIKGRITLIGCPKLDSIDYSEKLSQIIAMNDIREVLILRMEVPCCGGLEQAASRALKMSGKSLPLQVVVVTIDGNLRG